MLVLDVETVEIPQVMSIATDQTPCRQIKDLIDKGQGTKKMILKNTGFEKNCGSVSKTASGLRVIGLVQAFRVHDQLEMHGAFRAAKICKHAQPWGEKAHLQGLMVSSFEVGWLLAIVPCSSYSFRGECYPKNSRDKVRDSKHLRASTLSCHRNTFSEQR